MLRLYLSYKFQNNRRKYRTEWDAIRQADLAESKETERKNDKQPHDGIRVYPMNGTNTCIKPRQPKTFAKNCKLPKSKKINAVFIDLT